MTLKEAILQFVLERPVRKASVAELVARLTASGAALNTRFGGIVNRDANREALRHIIGIERWSQQRLKVFLGYPFQQDEYDGYRPSDHHSWNDLRDLFAEVRRDTVSIGRQIDQQKLPDTEKVPHNDVGPLSAKAWLKYILEHTNRESRRVH